MNDKQIIVTKILAQCRPAPPTERGVAFAPTNIALCKYWGKRNLLLNLPVTASLSISLAHKGVHAEITLTTHEQHRLFINAIELELNSTHAQRLIAYLDLFRPPHHHYCVKLNFNIPIAAGLASSACTFAALIRALNTLHQWQLDNRSLSILARLGSGSACRSIYNGFVEWHCGNRSDGMDSYADLIDTTWQELCVGLCLISESKKTVSSRVGMQRTLTTSSLYPAWPTKVAHDLIQLKKAIAAKDFTLLGRTAESNALAMHATMLAAWPPLLYAQADTVTTMHKVWALRQQGLALYFTQDAGPNIKLLFLASSHQMVYTHFPQLEVIRPFAATTLGNKPSHRIPR